MKKIRVVSRLGLPETNSSSSHSVCINTNKSYVSRDYWNFPWSKNRKTIKIPIDINFGWEWEKHNDVLTKTQYVLGAIMYKTKNLLELNKNKKVAQVKRIICDFTGADDVIFEWNNIISKLKEEGRDPDSVWPDDIGLSIDHNSSDIFSEILESSETIKDFIFNPDSWLFLGNDNSEPSDPEFYGNIEKTLAIASLDLPEPYGRVDFELSEFPCNIMSKIYYDSLNNDIMDSIVLSGGFKVLSGFSYVISGIQHAVFVAPGVENRVIKEFANGRSFLQGKNELIIENYTEGVDWIKFPFSIKSMELGEL